MAPTRLKKKQVQLIASGDLRLSANQVCWPAQSAMEKTLGRSTRTRRLQCRASSPVRRETQAWFHLKSAARYGGLSFDRSQRAADRRRSVWQYSHHIFGWSYDASRPNFDRRELERSVPGLVGMLNLNGSLTKAGVAYSTLWSEDFSDDAFLSKLREWLTTGKVTHSLDHVQTVRFPKGPLRSFRNSDKR